MPTVQTSNVACRVHPHNRHAAFVILYLPTGTPIDVAVDKSQAERLVLFYSGRMSWPTFLSLDGMLRVR